MSILHDHFERAHQAQMQGAKIRQGLYCDLMDTLFYSNGWFNEPLKQFVEWNFQTKLLGENHVISTGMNGWGVLNAKDFRTDNTGVSQIESKKIIFERAYTAEEKIAFIIDDQNPKRLNRSWENIAITWLSPNSQEMVQFLEQKQYLDFTL